MATTQAKKYLGDFLKIAPLSHALWRATEALAYSQVKLQKPTLDVGCGFGEFAGVVFNKVEMGIDINPKDLVKATKMTKYNKVLLADARKIPFKNNSYNSIVSVSVLEHIPQVEKALKEISRVLNKNGMFIFSVPTSSMPSYLLGARFFKSLGLKKLSKKYIDLHSQTFKHNSLKSKNWWIRQLDKNGFKIISVHGTITPTLLNLHEIFLVTALPSQIAKLATGRRLILFPQLRSNYLSSIFAKFVYLDKQNDINIFVVAQKK